MKSSHSPLVSAVVQDPPTACPEARRAPGSPSTILTPALAWSIALLAALGAMGMAPILLKLWNIWTDDPLKSLGMLIVPISVILTVRVWRQSGWELRGSWWGLALVIPGWLMSVFRQSVGGRLIEGPLNLNPLSPKIGLYLFGSGFVLLFAGWRVWKKAWFPLALLLCAQPVPSFFMIYGDLPLQNVSAHMARAFANLIGFPPASKELLRLMFTPSFGMFIAPGCDGIRGALTMGYLALIIGYLKRVSIPRWIAYTVGGVALGYVFNLVRLCALVVYYRMALGHTRAEHFAKWADYIIGGCLFLVAVLIFVWIASRTGEGADPATAWGGGSAAPGAAQPRQFRWRAGVFAVAAVFFAIPGLHAIRTWQMTLAAKVHHGRITPAQLNALLPKQLNGYTLNRAWQEEVNGQIRIESGAYDRQQHDESILGIFLPNWAHNMHSSWMARGEDPLQRADRTFVTATGPAAFDTAFYSDGITDSIAGNAFCTPHSCIPSPERVEEGFTLTLDPPDFETQGRRAVSIYFRIDRPHTSEDQAAVFQELTVEAKEFLAGVDFGEISRRFQ